MMNTTTLKYFRNAAMFDGWEDERYEECFRAVSNYVSPQKFDELVSKFRKVRTFQSITRSDGANVVIPIRQDKRKLKSTKCAIESYTNSLFYGKGSLSKTG